jgi:hypothetical protein
MGVNGDISTMTHPRRSYCSLVPVADSGSTASLASSAETRKRRKGRSSAPAKDFPERSNLSVAPYSALRTSVTFWNQGDVEVITVNKVTRKESILDDRKLTPADNIESLLSRYFQQIVEGSHLAYSLCRFRRS